MKKELIELKPFAMVCVVYGILSLLVVAASGHLIHIAMVWNLLLAAAPLVWAVICVGAKKRWVKILFGVLWMLFLPNAFYVLTDFIHISQLEFYTVWDYYAFKKVTYVYDAMLYIELINIAVGYVLATISGVWAVRKMHIFAEKRWRKFVPVMLAAVFLLVGYAIYIGRFIRLNSWDVLNPVNLVRELAGGMGWFAVEMTVVFGIYCAMIYGIYLVIRKYKPK